ncbi:serine/threonine-protein kinase M1, partial [Dimargaris xerosporica]
SRCLGQLGAIDPTRLSLAILNTSSASPLPADTTHSTAGTTASAPPFFDLTASDGRMDLICYILKHRVVNRFRSAKSPQEQGYYAYTIQELLKLCRFSTRTVGSLLDGAKPAASAPAVPPHSANEPTASTTDSLHKHHHIHTRWKQFSSDVQETLLTLLDAKYAIQSSVAPTPVFPVYRSKTEFGDWLLAYIQGIVWHTPCPETRVLIEACYPVLRCEEDHQLALFILPYAIVAPLGSDVAGNTTALVDEIKMVIEAAETEPEAGPSNYFYLCAQTVFRMMDQLTWWKVQEQAKLYCQVKATRSTSRNANNTDAHRLPLVLACKQLSVFDPARLAKAAMVC